MPVQCGTKRVLHTGPRKHFAHLADDRVFEHVLHHAADLARTDRGRESNTAGVLVEASPWLGPAAAADVRRPAARARDEARERVTRGDALPEFLILSESTLYAVE